MLIDVWEKVDEARALIEAEDEVDPASLPGRIRGE
jgi:hypothetical protein